MNRFISKYFFYLPITLAKGEAVMKYLPEYRQFQRLPTEQIEHWQRAQSLKLLQHAQLHSPFHKERVGYAIDALRNGASLQESMATIPLMTKSDLIEHIDKITTPDRRFSSPKTTGGSTGEPVKLFKNPNALARERAATWRSYEWAGVSIGDKQIRFWGVPHATSGKLKSRIIDFVSNRMRISAFNLSEASLQTYYQQILRFSPDYLYGYVSVIDSLATFMEESNLPPPKGLKAVITTSEVLTPSTRTRFERIFGVGTYNEYGCGEVGSIAHQCEHGSMHMMADNLYIETLNDTDKGEGEIVVTDFFNYATPLIRYRLGDYASIGTNECPCGRTLPILSGIHGRAYDLIKVPGGKSIHPEAVMYIFEGVQEKTAAFRHFQAIQDEIDHFSINIVPSQNWSDAIQHQIDAGLRKYISPELRTSYQIVQTIPREKSGKMRVIKSLI